MPTTDELDVRLTEAEADIVALDVRITALETGHADAQEKILKRATASEVLALEAARTIRQTTNDEEHTALGVRLGKLERQSAVTNQRLLRAVALNDDDELADDLTFPVAAQGIVLRSPDGSKFRVLVGDAGALSTEAVS